MIFRNIKSVLLAVLIVGLYSEQSAANTTGTAAYTQYVNIEQININAPYVQIRLSESINPAGCANSNGWYLRPLTDIGTEQMFELALKAHLNNKPIKLRAIGNLCADGYPYFDYVSIQ